MKILLTAVSALAFAAPALAQTTTAPASKAQAPVAAAPAASTPAAPATAPMPETQAPATATPATPVAAATPQTPDAIIATEFPTYDKDGSGSLSTAEFDSWMLALKEKSAAPAMKEAEKKTWLTGAFATADKDKNKAVSLTELTTYLTAGA